MSYNVSLTLKTHNESLPSGFNKQTKSLVIPYQKYGDSLDTVMININKFRDPTLQFTQLYNPLGQMLDRFLWKSIILKENMTLYIDVPQKKT